MILQKDFWEFMSKMNAEFADANTKALEDEAGDRAAKHSAYVAKLETQLRERFEEAPVRRTEYLSVVTLKPKKPSKSIAFRSAGTTQPREPVKRKRDNSQREPQRPRPGARIPCVSAPLLLLYCGVRPITRPLHVYCHNAIQTRNQPCNSCNI